jgi:hypothetical protein
METDCYFRKQVPESIYNYDYVASKWNWLPDEAGGGGLTYRKSSMMKKICDLGISDQLQDSFASNGIGILKGKTPTISDLYFSENIYSEDCIGVHQWWTCMINTSEDELKNTIKHYLILYIHDTI